MLTIEDVIICEELELAANIAIEGSSDACSKTNEPNLKIRLVS